ncbi:MAG: TonB family protein [bacterium]|nr:TonB family protein [bacterium]
MRNRFDFYIKISFLVAIWVTIIFCLLVPDAPVKIRKKVAETVIRAVELPNQMQQLKEPPPPPKPQMPVAAKTESEVQQTTTDISNFETFAHNPVAPQSETAVPFLAAETKPVLKNKIEPMYPEFARRAEIEGTVYVRYIIDTMGNVVDARVIKSLHDLLDAEAIKTVRQYKFTVARQRDKAIRVIMEQPIRFSLEK